MLSKLSLFVIFAPFKNIGYNIFSVKQNVPGILFLSGQRPIKEDLLSLSEGIMLLHCLVFRVPGLNLSSCFYIH